MNQPRENRTDDVYRLWILARALVLRSSGRPEELIAVARVVFPRGVNIRVVEEYPAGLTVRFEGVLEDTSARAMAALLRDAKADGVRLLVTWNPSTTPFRYAVTGVAELDSPSGYGAGNYNAVSA